MAATAAPTSDRNLVNRRDFPHEQAFRLWDGRIKFAEEVAKPNQKDYEEARKVLKAGTADDTGRLPFEDPGDSRVGTNILYSDLTKLTSFIMNRHPKPTCATAKGPRLKGAAKAVEKLVARVYRELSFHQENVIAIVEALLRNHGHVRQTWDHYRCLPGWVHCQDEVYWDPDAGGNRRRANWVVEQVEIPLDDLLNDPSIAPAIKRDLKEKRECHRRSRPDSEGGSYSANAAAEKEAREQVWDNQPGATKVLCYRIFTRVGLLPGVWSGQENADRGVEKPEVAGPHESMGGESGGLYADAYEEEMARNPHVGWKAPPAPPEDAPPGSAHYDPDEGGRQLYILMVKDFHKILKVKPWPMKHYDRDEWPILECRFMELPGDPHGVPWYRVIRANIKLINKAIEIAINDARFGARKVVLVDESVIQDPEQIEKLKYPKNQYEVLTTNGPGGIDLKEFASRDRSYEYLIPLLKDLHDEAVGTTDIFRGQSGDVEKTKYEAEKLADQTAAALTYLQEAIENFLEEQARLTVAALLCYVPMANEYEPPPVVECDLCQGTGGVAGLDEAGMGQCPTCGGSGMDAMATAAAQAAAALEPPKIRKRGAEFWLDQADAINWPEGLSVDEIRAEIIVGIKSGSTRRDYIEREVATLRNAGQDLMILYDKLDQLVPGAGLKRQVVYAKEICTALNVEEPERFVPDEAEIEALVQQNMMLQQQQREAEAAAKAPPPGQQEAEDEKGAAEAARAEAELELKAQDQEARFSREAADQQARQAQEERKFALEERKLALEENRHAAEREDRRAEMEAQVYAGAEQADMSGEIVRTLDAVAKAVEALAKTGAAMQAAAESMAAAVQAQKPGAE